MPDEGAPTVEIRELAANQYALFFFLDDDSALDGHTWSDLIQAYGRAENLSLDDVIHDPESDLYSATATAIEPLEEVAAAIDALAGNSKLRSEYLRAISTTDRPHDDEDMTTEEFLEWMVEAEYNMAVSRNFMFDLDSLRDAQQAETIKREIERRGYKVTLEIDDPDIYFQITARIQPLLIEVLEIEAYLRSVAAKFGVRYIGFGIN